MHVKWYRGTEPLPLLAEVEKARSVDKNGKVSYTNLLFEEMTFLLAGSLEFGVDLPTVDRHNLIARALFAPTTKGALLKDTFLLSLATELTRYLSQPFKQFLVVTAASVHLPRPQSVFRPDVNTAVVFPSRLPKRLGDARQSALRDQTTFAHDSLPSKYRSVVVRVAGRTVYQAIDRALDAVDLLRGIWNFYYNRGQSWRISGGTPKPVNRVFLHPIHSCHEVNGDLVAKEQWWYQPEYRAPATITDLTSDWSRIATFTRRVRRYLAHSHYAESVADALRQYVRALDRHDMEDAFIRLWSVLEQLTATQQANFERTVKRASFVYRDSELPRLVLDNLRRERNRLVHEGGESQAGEVCLYQLKRYVEALLEFHIRNQFQFSNLEEAGTFFDLPRSLSEITTKMIHYRAAKRYQQL